MSKSITNGAHGKPEGPRNGHTNGHARFAVAFPEDRSPPHSTEAEEGTLGAVLIDGAAFAIAREIVAPADFWHDDYGLIFRAMHTLAEAGVPIDAITLTDQLTRQGDFARIGGLDTLKAIFDRTPHAANVAYHASIVKGQAVRRLAIEEARKVIDDGFAGNDTPDQTAAKATAAIERLAQAQTTTQDEIISVCMADVEPEDVRWLWPGRIPAGMITLLIGDAGLGKSFLTQGIAATISVGGAWPDLTGECAERGSVVMLSAEDAVAHTIRPRLDAAGADATKVHAITMVRTKGGRKKAFTLASDIPRLDDMITRLGDVRLLIIDPVSAYLGGTDEHKNADVRGLLSPLKEMAERQGVAVLLVTHMNKGTGTKASYRATGSVAFGAAARVTWFMCKDPKDKTRRLFLRDKDNVGATPLGLAFRIADRAIQWEASPVVMTADEALVKEHEKPERQGAGTRGPIPAATRKAMDWVRDQLKLGPSRHGAVRKAAEEAGIAVGTFYNALDALGVIRFEDEHNKKWLRLEPVDDAPDDAPATIPINPDAIF